MRFLSGASIYILQCVDGSYYTGITRRSVEERLSEHVQGLIPGCYTDARRPVKLMFSEHYERIDEAIAAERRIKGWSRPKKGVYMRGDFPALVELAKRATRRVRRAPRTPTGAILRDARLRLALRMRLEAASHR
jgi:putative endonuclease